MHCSVVFGVTLRFIVINISSPSPTINTAAYYQRCVTTCATVAVVHRRPCSACWQRLACCSVNSRQLLAQNRDFCLPHLHSTPPLGGFGRTIAMPFGIEKLEWCGYRWWKNFDMFIRFDRIHERVGHTDRPTDTAWRHRPWMRRIARQKLIKFITFRACHSQICLLLRFWNLSNRGATISRKLGLLDCFSYLSCDFCRAMLYYASAALAVMRWLSVNQSINQSIKRGLEWPK